MGWLSGIAQPFSTIDLRKLKPEEYQRKVFRSEKTTTDELNKFSLFLQNLYSQYNFLFNANDQMQRLLQEAKKSNRDDYSQLLRFYPYDAHALASNKYLDTVVEKATTGIIMHDLRSKWVDELYFVLGNAYHLQKKYDSALAVYQYINFAFSPRDDGYFVPIGSNVSNSESIFSMVTRENTRSLLAKFTSTPKRNDAFLWQIKNMIDSGDVVQANSYIQLLRNDTYFPDRLRPYFDEVQSYYFYQLHRWDSSAFYLEKTMDITESNALKARKEFLIAQMYSRTDSLRLARNYFEKAARRTIDPELELHASISGIALADNTTEEKISQLQQLADKEKFYTYRDIIYYRQGKLLQQNGESAKAKAAFNKSITFNAGNPRQRSKSFMELAGITYRSNDYKESAAIIDSITSAFIPDKRDSLWLVNVKGPMSKVKDLYTIISRNDSILAVAAMPEKERMAFLEKEARRIRRMAARQGNEDVMVNLGNTVSTSGEQPTVDIFRSTIASGEWYFNSQSAITAGYNEFIRRFGNRKNEDNWIRSSRQRVAGVVNASGGLPVDSLSVINTIDSSYVTAQDLLLLLPLNDEQKKPYLDSIAYAVFDIGKNFQNGIMDFDASVQYYRDFIYHAPTSSLIPEVLYNLYISGYLARNASLADSARNALLKNYAESDWARLLLSQNTDAKISPASIANDTTKVYDMIYQPFLAGRFQEALENKKTADEMYGDHYWTPQLMYIESIYYVTQRQDSLAMNYLQLLKQRFSSSEMVSKADVMIDVLQRKSAIEKYLTELEISPYSPEREPVIARTSFTKPAEQVNELWKDLPKDVVIVLDKNGNPVPKFPETLEDIAKADRKIATGPEWEEKPAIATEPVEEEQKEATVEEPATDTKTDVAATQTETRADSLLPQQRNPFEKPVTPPAAEPDPSKQFTYEKAVVTYTMLVLDNVDQVYLNEVGNAFNRFNLIMFENIHIDIQQKTVGERYTILLLGPFKDGNEANGYIGELAPNVSNTIIPWLDNTKYLIRTVNKNDLDKINSQQDLENYLKNHQ